MNGLNLREIKNHDVILGIILLIYIFGGYQTPYEIAPYINNFIGYMIMLVIFSIGLKNANVIVAILLGLAFVVLVQRSREADPKNVMPSQNYRDSVMSALNIGNTFNSSSNNINSITNSNSNSNKMTDVFGLSGNNTQLEEMMVSKMANLDYREESPANPATFKPTMSNNCNAYELNEQMD